MSSIYIPSFVGICTSTQYPYQPKRIYIYTTCKAVNGVGHWLLGVTGVKEGGYVAWETHAVVYHGGFSKCVCARCMVS